MIRCSLQYDEHAGLNGVGLGSVTPRSDVDTKNRQARSQISMAPKKKKKSKAELEAERLRLEEEARLAEEERLRQEEEERKRKEAEEAERQRLTKLHLEQETEALKLQKEKLLDLFGEIQLARDEAKKRDLISQEWERYCQASHLPNPLVLSQMNGYFNTVEDTVSHSLSDCTKVCEDILHVIRDSEQCELQTQQQNDQGTVQELVERRMVLQGLIQKQIDDTTAFLLQHNDRYMDDNGDVMIGHKGNNFAVCIWVNVAKNPRIKSIEMKPIGEYKAEISKQIALASVALRLQYRNYDEYFDKCTNQFMAVGGVFYVDLLTLPPSCQQMGDWTLRSVTQVSKKLEDLPYPIPPAGVDPATYRSTEEPQPLSFKFEGQEPMILLYDENQDDQPKVGWWDTDQQLWNTEGISSINMDYDSNILSFNSTHIGSFAILQSRVCLLPYLGWNVRPTDGEMGSTVSVTLELQWPYGPVEISIGPGYAQLLSPILPQLQSLKGRQLQPRLLLQRLQVLGVNLCPLQRDAQFLQNVCYKEEECERAMCEDLALLCGAFLVAQSRFNKEVCKDECIARISEIVDWEDGGRTEAKHVRRVFTKERETGDQKVLCVIRRGVKGVAYCDALDKRETYLPLPGYDTLDYEESVYGEVHCSLVSLIQGSEKTQDEELAARLKVSEEAIQRVRGVDPLMTQSLAQLLVALKVFSFC
eukprot:TRINITY_DN5539_c0_g2_i4.p1 TRINITY_DN5539_c0_g2~~TRINITY_DN5539_c0_g2_i4.p1  ORF type:complete len:701 (-),score=83.62 TRINITY_DN5539_c0_g2_i4:171-2273(-)